MTPGRDPSNDDALAWDGDDDPTLNVGTEHAAAPAPRMVPDAAPSALPDGYTALGKGSEEVGHVDGDGAVTMSAERGPMGNATLISLGVLGGVYLLYAIGWLIGANRLSLIASLFLDPIAFQVTLWLAVLAPPVWFVTVMLLTRTSRPWIRFALLAVGVVVLVPWPFVLAGAAL